MGQRLVLLVGLSLLASGCAAADADKKAAPGPSEPVGTVHVGDNSTGDLGSIVGKVVDDEQVPIAQATVAIVELQAEVTTAADGGFEFKDVPIGAHTVVANRLGYDSVARKVEVTAQAQTEVTIALKA